MPLYDFLNTETNEIIELRLNNYDEKLKYLDENPHMQSTMTKAPGIISGASGSAATRVPDGFKEVLSKVAEANPHTAFAEKQGGMGIKQAKTREVVKKHVERVTKRIESGNA